MDLVKRLKAKGLYEEDDDFSGDEEEFFFMVGSGAKYRTDHKVKDKVAMQIKDKAPDQELASTMLEDGPLANGGAPALPRMSEEGTKNLMEIMHGVTKKIKRKPVKDDEEEANAEKLEPTEPWEPLCCCIDSCSCFEHHPEPFL